MKNLLKLNVILIIASTLFVACEKEEDPQKLTISDVVAENHDGGVGSPARWNNKCKLHCNCW
jgi:hypothetical protein